MEHKWRIEKALRAFASEGETQRRGFDELLKDGRGVFIRFLCPGCSIEEAEDIVQRTFAQIWARRDSLRFETTEQWYFYLYRSARNGRADQRPRSEPTPDDVVDPDDLETIVAYRRSKQTLYEMADEIWLGPPTEDALPKRLAAKLCFVDQKSLPDVIRLISLSSAKVKPKTQEDLSGWLNESWVLRRTVFDAICYSNDRLTTHLLGIPAKDRTKLDKMFERAQTCDPDAVALDGWLWGDVHIVLMRYRYGMTQPQIRRRLPPTMSNERVESTIARCTALLPFEREMTSIWSGMQGLPVRESALSENPIWKRFVFQYHSAHCLPQEHILERTAPAAAVSGYALNNINVWTATRLRDELVKHMQKTQ